MALIFSPQKFSEVRVVDETLVVERYQGNGRHKKAETISLKVRKYPADEWKRLTESAGNDLEVMRAAIADVELVDDSGQPVTYTPDMLDVLAKDDDLFTPLVDLVMGVNIARYRKARLAKNS